MIADDDCDAGMKVEFGSRESSWRICLLQHSCRVSEIPGAGLGLFVRNAVAAGTTFGGKCGLAFTENR
jgi:hypothetical protein